MKRIVSVLVTATLAAALLVACNDDPACAAPGGGSGSGSRSGSSSSYRSNSKPSAPRYKAPSNRQTSKSKPSVKFDDDWFEDDDCDD